MVELRIYDEKEGADFENAPEPKRKVLTKPGAYITMINTKHYHTKGVKMGQNSARIEIRCEPEFKAWLESKSKEMECSLSAYIRWRLEYPRWKFERKQEEKK